MLNECTYSANNMSETSNSVDPTDATSDAPISGESGIYFKMTF